MHARLLASFVLAFVATSVAAPSLIAAEKQPTNVLLIVSDDLTSTALSCYGNTICKTPNIDRLAADGIRFTHAYCNATYCGPSRASFLSGYYPHATGVLGYTSPRPAIGTRATWPQYFKNAGYYTARVSKIYHMGVPGGVELDPRTGDQQEGNGADDEASWTERFNSPGPEWKAPGNGETLENNPDGKKPVMGGNTFVVVEADGGDDVHSDGKTAIKASQLIAEHAGKPFFLAIGFVRPHVPFVAPKNYYEPYLPYDKLPLPEKAPKEWDNIPRSGINYKTSKNMKMDERRQRKAIGGYYASVAFMDAQVGKVLDALEKSGQADNTIVIFTSDHGYHLGEHDFWAKVSLRDESSKVPLIVKVPGKKPAVCESYVELIDLYPTIASLCNLEAPTNIQGKNFAPLVDDPTLNVRDTAFCVAPMTNGFLLRDKKWAYLQYGEDSSLGIELYDIESDPKQFNNLAKQSEYADVVATMKSKLAAKLKSVRDCDLRSKP